MEAFLSYRFTGEDPVELDSILWKIRKSLSNIWLETFCSLWLEDFFRQNKMTADQIYCYCNNRLSESDIFLAFIKSEEESKWMKMELEEALRLNKKIVLAIKEWLNHDNFRTNASKIIEFRTYDEIYEILNIPTIFDIT